MILVIGDVILDKYIECEVAKISPEAPVPVLKPLNTKCFAGGAANVARNVKSLGGEVKLVSALPFNKELSDLVDIDNFFFPLFDRKISVKTRYIDINSKQQITRIDEEETKDITEKSSEQILEYIKNHKNDIDLIILSDYNKGVLHYPLLKLILAFCKENNIITLVDPKKKRLEVYENAHTITPNLLELYNLSNQNSVTDAAHYCLLTSSIKQVIVTQGAKGCSLFSAPLSQYYPSKKIENANICGAGDTFIAALAVKYVETKDIHKAIVFANDAAEVAVTKPYTAIVHTWEIKNSNPYIWTIDPVLSNLIYTWKKEDLKIGFTNGCFDLLHVGHVHLLEETKKYCDKLIVGINSGLSRMQSNKRHPIYDDIARQKILSSNKYVDYVTIFDEPTPLELIKKIQPDILFKGSDYIESEVVGKEYAKEVKLIDIIYDVHTSNTIRKILVAD